MQTLALPRTERATPEHATTLLLADDDVGIRTLVSASVHGATGGGRHGIEVLEAEDGAEAIQRGLQQRPQLALLEINMPRVGGIEVAVVLRELLPELRLALYSGDTGIHRERAQDLGLPLFDKSDLDRVTQWVSVHAAVSPSRSRHQQPQNLSPHLRELRQWIPHPIFGPRALSDHEQIAWCASDELLADRASQCAREEVVSAGADGNQLGSRLARDVDKGIDGIGLDHARHRPYVSFVEIGHRFGKESSQRLRGHGSLPSIRRSRQPQWGAPPTSARSGIRGVAPCPPGGTQLVRCRRGCSSSPGRVCCEGQP